MFLYPIKTWAFKIILYKGYQMKKFFFALAILSVCTSTIQAQSSVTISGTVDAGAIYSSKVYTKNNISNRITKDKFEVKSGHMQGSSIKFKGIEDLGDNLEAIFNIEVGFTDNNFNDTNHSTLFRRRSVVGLNGNFGKILLGRQTDFADLLNQYTSAADFGNFTANVGSSLNRLQGTPINNSVSYTTNNRDGFTGNILYGFSETVGKISFGQVLGIGGKYENGPLTLGINFNRSKQDTTPSNFLVLINNNSLNSKNAIKTLNLIANYQCGTVRIYGNWSRVRQYLNTASFTELTTSNRLTHATLKLSEKADMYEIGTTYALNPTLKLFASMEHTRAVFNGLYGKGNLTQLNLGADYWLSKRTDIYAVISNIYSSKMTNPGIIGNFTTNNASQTAFGIGIRHKF